MSNVLKRNRSTSSLEYYSKAIEIRNSLTDTVLNSKKFRNPYMTKFKHRLFEILLDITESIVAADSIYPMTYEEAIQKRSIQTKAISDCYVLKEVLSYYTQSFNITLSLIYKQILEIDELIKLLKHWRKLNNKYINKFNNNKN